MRLVEPGDVPSIQHVHDSLVIDVEQQISKVWNPSVRPTVAEAWRCYGAGAYRAAVTLTWAAVCADLLDKITQLGEDGDGEAATWIRPVQQARETGTLDTESVQVMQKAESNVLIKAMEYQLLDDVGARQLERIRQDRHLCVHPSLRALEEDYVPSAEYARAHLATALEALLTQPPTQGKRAVTRFQEYLRDPRFNLVTEHVEQTFYDQIRSGTRRYIVELAAKHAVLELPAGDGAPSAETIADRCAQCLEVFVHRDRDLVRDAFSKTMERTAALNLDQLERSVARCGRLDAFWDVMPEPVRLRVKTLADAVPVPKPNPPGSRFSGQGVGLDATHARFLALTSTPAVVAILPELTKRFRGATDAAKADVLSVRVDSALIDYIPPLIERAQSFRSAEEITSTIVLPYAHVLDLTTLQHILDAWKNNQQCWNAARMHEFSAELFHATKHLRPNDRDTWQSFLAQIRDNFAREPGDTPYELLEEVLTEEGYWPRDTVLDSISS